jgi:hypothetical protein
MKTTLVSARAKLLNEILKKAKRRAVILETVDGQRFVLASIEGWDAYEVNEEGDITENRKLMDHLLKRRRGNPRHRLSDVKTELGLTPDS